MLRIGVTAEADMHKIVSTALAPHLFESGRVIVEGPKLQLPEKKVLAFNELVTNAIEYGSLSNKEGQVAISWQAADNEGLHLKWRERGGPVVKPPLRSGFGSRLIQRHVASAFGADVRSRGGWFARFYQPIADHSPDMAVQTLLPSYIQF